MEIKKIAKQIEEKGGRLYLVGGAIRDALLGKQIQDEDYCVTGMTANEFQKLFPEVKIRGKSFKVYEMDKKEFAMARKEEKTGKGHKEFLIQTGKEISIKEDLERRDITINAMAQDVLTGEIIDPFGGRKDLENRRIKMTTKAFREDPLRVYRVARFASVLDFSVEQNTIKAMQSLKEELNTLSKERVFEELKKALASKKPSIFFQVLKRAKVLSVHFKEVYDLIGSLQPIKYHPEGDSFIHAMLVLDNCANVTEDLAIRFSSLVHDLGKGTTPKKLYPHHHGHDERGVDLVEILGKRIGAPNQWIECGKVAAKEHMIGGIFGRMTPAKKVSFIERVDNSCLGLEGLQIVVTADRSGRGSYAGTEEEKQNSYFLEIGKACLKEVTGKQIKEEFKLTQGKLIGEKLHQKRIEWMKKRLDFKS